ncbi:antitoxin ChpS [Allofrancisella inopinata]|uniref:AbrB/MazE/SpoVT family DNA-binding domain-containing protein n=1 Tax=Allofrancisella inopinata TaxID=1085647 RepID=A0AAE6YIM4_9GAMM|nr:AbrB/MazE/SpoVT family DNA-binding domain-containing protein [Allofrancisella inopinata]QIV96221.1 AbrB/MazE/SpoVT family DNA-binding domain-containing protein [Allofrancisella inopinata]TDT74491.1 antitoxin ChpS [Allofrancisella inopinata]
MTTLTIRKTGNAAGINIPKKILKLLNLHIGDELDLNIKDEQIILKPHHEELTLEQLLAESDKDSFRVTPEDEEWLNPKGMEI